MKERQYKVLVYSDDPKALEKRLNKLARKGYRVVSYCTDSTPNQPSKVFGMVKYDYIDTVIMERKKKKG